MDAITGNEVNKNIREQAALHYIMMKLTTSVATSLTQLSLDVCEEQRRSLEQTLRMIEADLPAIPNLPGLPDEGVQFIKAGAVFYAAQCPLINVTIRNPSECTQVHMHH